MKAVPLFAAFLTTAHAAVQDVVLFAGQSNVIGNPDQAGNLWENDESQTNGLSLETMVPILTRRRQGNPRRFRERQRNDLIAEIMQAREAELPRATNEADLLLDMASTFPGIFDSILDPTPDAWCSFQRLNSSTLTALAQMSSTSQCGNDWGPELMIGKTITSLSDFLVRKISPSGSSIADWRPQFGTDPWYWPVFEASVSNLANAHPDCDSGPCQYTAFIWFQGIGDAWTNDASKGTNYTNELNNFIPATRQLMFNAGAPYASADDIPLVMVQIGQFGVNGNYGTNVAAAQELFCDADPNCVLVETVDLSRFYHYEAAAFLIIGERIARALDVLLGGGPPPPPPPTPPPPSCSNKGGPCASRADCCANGAKCTGAQVCNK